MRAKISQSLVERAPTPEGGRPTLYADSEMRGFYLIVTRTKRSFYVQSLVSGRQVRTKLGDHPSMDAKQARDAARKMLVSMRSGMNPNEERRRARARGITLRDALEMHLSAKALSPRTVADYRYNFRQYLPDWLERPLAELGADRSSVRERHRRITDANGATVADGTFRVFRAVYNRGLREHPDLPPNPAGNVDYHGLKRRRVDATADQLLAWGAAVLDLHPVRRDLHLFMMLSGMRRTAACQARAADLHLDRGVLHVPKPKGGAARAFDLPLSDPLRDLLAHRAAETARLHRNGGWLFPAESSSGHVAEVAQHELGGLYGHALRHVFATLAVEAGVPLLELKVMLNHAASGVTAGYIHVGIPHLLRYQQLASSHILGLLGITWTPYEWPPSSIRPTPGPLTSGRRSSGAQAPAAAPAAG